MKLVRKLKTSLRQSRALRLGARGGLVQEFFSVIVHAVRDGLVFDVLDEHVRVGTKHF
jgi:hypothetical protein